MNTSLTPTPNSPRPGDQNNRSDTIAAISLLSVLKAIWDHKYLAAAVWLAVTCASVYVIYRLPAIYRAEAEILVESQRIPERYVSATVNADLQDRLNGLNEQVLSDSRLSDMIEQYGLYKQDRKRLVHEELLAKIRSDIIIKPTRPGPGGPGAFQIAYQGGNPQIAAQIANHIASFFIDENLRQRATEAEGASEFLQRQLAEAKKRLEDQEAMLSRYKLAHSGELPEQENALLSSLGQTKVQLTGIQDALNRAQQNKVMLESSLSDAQITSANFAQTMNAALSAGHTETAGMATAAPPPPQKESERLAAQLAALTIRYTPEHPEVRRLQSELQRTLDAEALAASNARPVRSAPSAPASGAARREPLEAAPGAAMNRQRIEMLKGQIAAAAREIEELSNERRTVLASMADLESHIARLPLREQEMASVTRDYETTKTAYQALLDKKLAADVAADMEKHQKAERFVLIERARVPEMPIKPKRQLLAGAAALFALALSMGLAAGLELRKGVLLGEWELPGTLTVLGRVPVIAPQTAARKAAKLPGRGRLALAAKNADV